MRCRLRDYDIAVVFFFEMQNYKYFAIVSKTRIFAR